MPRFPILKILLLFFVVPICVNLAHAATLPLYLTSTISEWEPEFRSTVEDNYARLFQPKLNNVEAQLLRKVRFEFPRDQDSVLFGFHSRTDGGVALPVASLLFLKDLATAQAWLEVSGYSPQTILDYLAIIRQGRLSEWPAAERLPLQALGIPANALSDQRILDRRNEILDKSIIFILGHELGHIIQGFSAQINCSQKKSLGNRCDFQALQKSETSADVFAVEMFRRMKLVPSASNFFFALNSRLSFMPFEFKRDIDWQNYAKGQEHPLDSVRINTVATLIEQDLTSFSSGFTSPAEGTLKVSNGVNDLRILARLIDDRELSGLQISWAKSLAPEDIKPRRSHEPRLRPTRNDLSATQPLVGYFSGKAQFSSGGSLPLEVVLRAGEGGTRLIGDAMLGGIRGRIEGRHSDLKHASATWAVAGDTYQLTLVASPLLGHLQATYQSTTSPSAKGEWVLDRKQPSR